METKTTSAKILCYVALMIMFFTQINLKAQTFMWASRFGGPTKQETANLVARDNIGNFYVTGSFYNTSITLGNFTLTKSESFYPEVFIAKYNSSGVVLWAKRVGGSGNDFPSSITTDNNGNVYISGFSFSSSMTLDNIILGSPFGGGDAFIGKFDSNGNPQWVKRMGGSGPDNINYVKTDNNGNVYGFGTYRGPNINLGGTILTNGHNGQDELFLAKWDGMGNTIWAISAVGTNLVNAIPSGSGIEVPRGLDIDSNNDIYLAGHFATAKFQFGSNFVNNSGAEGTYDIFLTKFNSSGTLQWIKKEGGNGNEFLTAMSQDNMGRIDINGSYNNIYNTYSFTIGTTTLTSPQSVSNTFLAQYNNNGVNTWVKAGRTQSETTLRTDSIGNIYITGRYNAPCNDLSVSTNELAIFKYNSTGDPIWIKKFSGSSNGNNIKNFVITKNGDLVIVGDILSNTMTFGSYTITKSDLLANNIDFYVTSIHGINQPVITATPNLNIFTGQMATLSVGSANNYIWSNGSTTPTISVGAGTYSVITNDGISNSATSCPVTVSVSPMPTITTSGPTSFCQGGVVVLTASSGASSYLWSNGATTQNITVTTSGNYTVTCSYPNGSSVTTPPTVVTVNPYPVVPAITGNKNVCIGNTTQLSNTTPGGVWNSTNPNIATISSTGLVTGVSSGYVLIQYRVTSAAGCNTTVTTGVNVASAYNMINDALMTYTVNTVGYNNVCIGPSLTRAMLFKVTIDNPITNYQPMLRSISVRRNSLSAVQDYDNHDSVAVYYTNDGTLSENTVINNGANQIGRAFANITQIGTNMTVNITNGFVLTPGTHHFLITIYEAPNSAGQGFDAYNGNTLAGTPTPTSSTAIQYRLISFNWGCTGGQQRLFVGINSTRHINQTCGSQYRITGEEEITLIPETETDFTVICYPNPFNNKTTFKVSSEKGGQTKLFVTDMTGRLVKEVYNGQMEAGLVQELEFFSDNLTKGMYFYTLTSGNKNQTGKMIIQ